MTAEQPPPNDPNNKDTRRRNIAIALILVSMSLFMYVSFIIKTMVKGP